jgi:hypothetical protein
MATDRKGKVSLTIRPRNNKPKNISSNDASKLKDLNKAFEAPSTKVTKGTKRKASNMDKTDKTEKTEKKAKKVNTNKKEKKPRKWNAYIVFSMEVRESVKKNHPTASIIDIAKKIGEKWRALSDSEKAKYKK